MSGQSLFTALRADVRARLALIRGLNDLDTVKANLVEQHMMLRDTIEDLLEELSYEGQSPVLVDLAVADEICEDLGRQLEAHRRIVGGVAFGVLPTPPSPE